MLINRVRFPILLVGAEQGKLLVPCSRFRLRIWSHDIRPPVPSCFSLLILHTQAESIAYSRDSSRFSRRRPFIYTANRHRVSPEVIRSRNCIPMGGSLKTMCMPPPRTPRTMVRIEAAGKIYKQVQPFTYLGCAVTETQDMSVEIARRTRACRMRIRRYLRELYDQPKVALSLKTRMVKAEAIEALLYGCSTWTLCQEHFAKLRTVHHRALLRIIGAQRKRPDHRMTSYNRALEITRCENIETTLRTRRL